LGTAACWRFSISGLGLKPGVEALGASSTSRSPPRGPVRAAEDQARRERHPCIGDEGLSIR
jgi:hypothetical protein